ncbi:pentatricopeptide repeat-containing protein At2g01390 [Phalaenopsis equestris]|uniref:pentatricopeptide repeat-containing protein At2g01390 n=1 Tax=Phalaenopsis equestris TaxID=78828 RepID=UPI0009E65DD1|nr:pentatricopeptide repeat-containing protein At2g01390 [Phalaenopsis equestris]XP_020574688.1 pentatricopeptide repeat-containing protein At2g01390 [Phalaenopsis equestris]XP_020574689.1 pentatricopeptide repeat-containing protein At2g01390 [Phalaenopsis equestris]XP_020574690.1 pentatricopeptide repeat-containing protein At2g01390 [Phalaenopsis equestris]XP_020574691.1 pentatricopeptide repeat-containing protein At2g01390 [Phalaenopsis equestris]XP_020574692.1 pentatricopeptide repeat-conta
MPSSFVHRQFAGARHRLTRTLPNPPKQHSPPPAPSPFMRSTIHKISTILRSLPWKAAQTQLLLLPVRWESFTVNRVLKTHPPMEKAWLFFNWSALLPGFKHDHFTYTTMLDIFGEAGRIESMRKVLREMEEKGLRIDAATYTSVMHWIAKDGDFEGAVEVWEEMKRRRGCRPTGVSYTAFMKVLFDHGRPREAAGVYREMLDLGIRPNCFTYTVMMEYLAGAGLFKEAFEIMKEMQEAGILPDKATCNILIQKCSIARETMMVTQILSYMKENSIVLRRPVFLEAMEAFRNFSEINHLLREVNPHLALEGIEDDTLKSELACDDPNFLVDRSIITNFLATKNLVAIDHLLCQMINKETQMNSEVLFAIILANCKNSRPAGAMLAFHCTVKGSCKLERSAYISLIGLLIRANMHHMVLEIIEEMLSIGINFGTYLLCLLIYQLGSAGFPDSAAKIFNALQVDHNSSTYTALMNGFFQAGEVDKCLQLYSRMRNEGISASCGTYEVLIAGLERAGRIHDANIYRKKKRTLNLHDFSQPVISTDEIFCNRFFSSSIF